MLFKCVDYISSASAYHKPAASYIITEGTTLANPHWQYSRNKIICEEFLMKKYREDGFPITIVRPSHTYDERSIPVSVHGRNGSWQVIKRMMEGKTLRKPAPKAAQRTDLWGPNGAPAATQRSGCGGERRSGGMSEFSARRDGNEGYEARDDDKQDKRRGHK